MWPKPLILSELSMVGSNPTISSNPAGRTVRVGLGKLAYEAFVPNRLPPEFPLDRQLFVALSDADRALGELSGLGRMLPNPDLLINPFIRKEAVLSSRIEGTQATITELYEFEAEGETRGRRQGTEDVQEVFNYVEAFWYGLHRIDTLPISGRLLKEMHARLLQGVRGRDRNPGEFRTTQNWIGPKDCLLNDATFVPPPIAEMADALGAFELYLHEPEADLPPLVRLALIHCQFEMIHPFLDGNGRIGRLLISLLLVHWKLLPLPLLYLSAFFEQDRDLYYDRLLATSRDGAWRDWVLYFLGGVAVQARDATERAKRLQDLQQRWRGEVTQARSSALLLILVDSLFRSPVLTIPHAARLMGVTYPAAKANVEKLLAVGILHPFRGGPAYGRRFWAPDVLTVIGD
jgi:Fic family protein